MEKVYNPKKVNYELLNSFLNDSDLDHNIICLLKLYVLQNSDSFQYLASEFANILNVGIRSSIERERFNKESIEFIICLFSNKNISERDYFIGSWKSFSVLFPTFEHFDKHSIAVQKAYFRFEKYFEKVMNEIHTDSWYSIITNYEWWKKVEDFYLSRHAKI